MVGMFSRKSPSMICSLANILTFEHIDEGCVVVNDAQAVCAGRGNPIWIPTGGATINACYNDQKQANGTAVSFCSLSADLAS
jgi:hypothetical protein